MTKSICAIWFSWIDTDKPGTWKGKGLSPWTGRMIAVLRCATPEGVDTEHRLVVNKEVLEDDPGVRLETFNILMELARMELGI